MIRKMVLFLSDVLFLVALVSDVGICQSTGEVPIDSSILSKVIQVETPNGRATGFVVSCEVLGQAGDSVELFFLVTNKHVIGDWNIVDKDFSFYYDYIDLSFCKPPEARTRGSSKARIRLIDKDGRLEENRVFVHDGPAIDVALLNIAEENLELLTPGVQFYIDAFDIGRLMPSDAIKLWNCNIGSQVILLGYPGGISSSRIPYPFAKAVWLASVPGEDLELTLPAKGRDGIKVSTRLQGRIIAIDGLMSRGNSGGPLILPIGLKLRMSEQGRMEFQDRMLPNMVLGIHSSSLQSTGLGFAYASEYIIEAIDGFLTKHRMKLIHDPRKH